MIRADSFLLHKKSKTPPEKGGVFTSLDGLRRFRTLSQLNKYTSEAATDPIGGILNGLMQKTLWERACSRRRYVSRHLQ
ncbi:hypothetical protein BK665_05865 [Pseudomonas frederiksbergensis]|uniref:Uncharacterized protein n=1 Tax=Pseudomonas frederiksbergensis TaxID=104087 RepID=A0A423KP67_9PSED|nr:hypothetical protein BK665_05865 [Pseudomonas frederiksbergensis]